MASNTLIEYSNFECPVLDANLKVKVSLIDRRRIRYRVVLPKRRIPWTRFENFLDDILEAIVYNLLYLEKHGDVEDGR